MELTPRQQRRQAYTSVLCLERGIPFHQDDLIANRKGKMTDHQRRRLRADNRNDAFICVLLSGLLLFMLLASEYMAQTALLRLLIAGILVALILFTMTAIKKRAQDLRVGKVGSVTGMVERHSSTGKFSSYHISIKKQRFTVSREAYYAFDKDAYYTVYYALYSRQILSAE